MEIWSCWWNIREFFQPETISVPFYGCTTLILIEHREKRLGENVKNAAACIYQILEVAPHKKLYSHLPLISRTNRMNKNSYTVLHKQEKLISDVLQ